jgi:uncharacterized DUF497 family protein
MFGLFDQRNARHEITAMVAGGKPWVRSSTPSAKCGERKIARNDNCCDAIHNAVYLHACIITMGRPDRIAIGVTVVGLSLSDPGRLLFVAYAMRGHAIRIISARLAEPFERRRYHGENKA